MKRRRPWCGSELSAMAPGTKLTGVADRIDFTVMPLLILGFFALQLDRGNMYFTSSPPPSRPWLTIPFNSGNALTDYFFVDVGITQDQYNVGQQMLSLGIVLLEVRFAMQRACV